MLAPHPVFLTATKQVLDHLVFWYTFVICILPHETECFPDTLESDLDIQYITAMGAGVSTLFNANSNTQTIFIYDWATSVVEGKVPSANVRHQLIATALLSYRLLPH